MVPVPRPMSARLGRGGEEQDHGSDGVTSLLGRRGGHGVTFPSLPPFCTPCSRPQTPGALAALIHTCTHT